MTTRHEIEYNAIREAAAFIDVSPLYKYLVTGPDATRLVDRVITRDANKLAVGRVYYTSWCNEDGLVVDDGTVARLDEQRYRWTAADPSLRWFQNECPWPRRRDRGRERTPGRAGGPGPAEPRRPGTATDTAWGTSGTSAGGPRRSRGSPSTSPGPDTRATSATRCGWRSA